MRMAQAPKPHDPRMPSLSVDVLNEQYAAALAAEPQETGDELGAELARFEAAYGVLAAALQDGE